MARLPLVPHHDGMLTDRMAARIARIADAVLDELPELARPGPFDALRARRLDAGPTLHVDDLGAIQFEPGEDLAYLQDRARLRAGGGDVVASCAPPEPAFEPYCRDRLGLGAVRWLRPRERGPTRGPALASWIDRDVRRELVRLARSEGRLQVHPHMGCSSVWTLGLLLARASRRPVQVIAPPPALARAVNDKGWFQRSVTRLFGTALVPRGARAGNLATLAHLVRRLASRSGTVVVKLPDSAGGRGNFVLDAAPLRGLPLAELRRRLREQLEPSGWKGTRPLVASVWERAVRETLSTQLWIPPPAGGAPIVEGLFTQLVEGASGEFVGCLPADLSGPLHTEALDRSWQLALLYQQLGYVGRCSFDLLVLGEPGAEHGRLVFLECNGRWGGASAPMTLLNRLLGDHRARPFDVREVSVPGLGRLSFDEVLAGLDPLLLDARTGRGWLVLYNPGSLRARGVLYGLALGGDPNEARRRLEVVLPARLRLLAGRKPRRADVLTRRFGPLIASDSHA